ncbi:hypothetical protein T01_10345 [Trichinella spiralis]|uniref:Uncharacterized protein n=1 Tax=Trichinella spiralis TaxID=6334 RepID=A0A0V1BU41_TRISP|nr:hypothetical protein T01_10345 [Trichinella spiralis]
MYGVSLLGENIPNKEYIPEDNADDLRNPRRSVIRHARIAPLYPSQSPQSTEKQLSAEAEAPFVHYSESYASGSHFYVIGYPVSYVTLKNIPFYCKNHSDSKGTNSLKTQFSVDSNELSNNGRRIHFQNYFQRMQKRLDPQYFQLGFGKRFIVNEENYPTNMQCCAHKKCLNSKPYLLIAFHLTVELINTIANKCLRKQIYFAYKVVREKKNRKQQCKPQTALPYPQSLLFFQEGRSTSDESGCMSLLRHTAEFCTIIRQRSSLKRLSTGNGSSIWYESIVLPG